MADITVIEEWRPVTGYETRYEVSNLGRIRKLEDKTVLAIHPRDGYMRARLSGPRAMVRVHRVVAQAFIPNPSNKPYINHIDCNPSNNCVKNLEWCTQAENISHSRRLGRMKDDYWIGRRGPVAKISDDIIRKMRSMWGSGNHSLMDIARATGSTKRTVHRAVRGETYVYVK